MNKEVVCSSCRSIIFEKEVVCPFCGASQKSTVQPYWLLITIGIVIVLSISWIVYSSKSSTPVTLVSNPSPPNRTEAKRDVVPPIPSKHSGDNTNSTKPIPHEQAQGSFNIVLPMERDVVFLIQNTVGTSSTNRNLVKKVQGVRITEVVNQGVKIEVFIAVNYYQRRRDETREICEEIKRVGKVLKMNYPQMTEFVYYPTFLIKDKYGNIFEGAIREYVYKKETLYRIQWDNLIGEEVFEAADTHKNFPGIIRE
jgi:hypothetical protein